MKNFLQIVGFIFVVSVGIPETVFAHCDTLEGPVIQEARVAFETKDATPLLKWVPQKEEGNVKAAFEKALKKRTQGPDTKEKADMEFFEVLVKIHRESEGAKYTGIKPAGTPPEPAVVAADEAIAAGSPDVLVQEMSNGLGQGIQERLNRVLDARKHMNESIEAGRAYVAAYVDYMHYVEGVHNAVTGSSAHHLEKGVAEEEHQHKH